MTKNLYASHVESVLQANGITVAWRAHGTSGRAWRKRRHIFIAPVKSAVTYAVAMHEVGHVLGRNPKTRLAQEAAAWQWARANALDWCPVMEAKMQDCLASYLAWSTRRKGVTPSSDFNNLISA